MIEYIDLSIIQNEVEQFFNVKIGVKTRLHDVAKARSVYCKLAKDYTTHSLSKIAEYLNVEGFDHSVVIYRIKRIEKYNECPQFKKRYYEILSIVDGFFETNKEEVLKSLDLKRDYDRLAHFKNQYDIVKAQNRRLIKILNTKGVDDIQKETIMMDDETREFFIKTRLKPFLIMQQSQEKRLNTYNPRGREKITA